jgi:UDP-glucose 4-epimerase
LISGSVLLLGGTGFIGSALAERLQRECVPVHVLGRDDSDELGRVLPLCDSVIHLASATTPGSSASHPGRELANLEVTLRLVALLDAHPKKRLVFVSSGGTVYGNPQRLPVTEFEPTAPLSNYGAGKVAQEAFCLALTSRGHAVTIARPSNAYGPGQQLRQGFGLIRTMLEHARGGTTLEIWGDGENTRDFIYIDDLVEAIVRILSAEPGNAVLNLGSGNGISINRLRQRIQEVTGRTVMAVHHPARATDVRSIVLSTARAEALLDWQPQVLLDDGIARTWDWMMRR